MRVFWSPDDDAKLRRILETSPSLEVAAERASREIGRQVSRPAIESRARRCGFHVPTGFARGRLPVEPVPSPDSVRPTDPLPPPMAEEDHGVDVDLSDLQGAAQAEQPSIPPDPVAEYARRADATSDKRTIKTLIERLRAAEARQAFLDDIAGHTAPPSILPRERNSGIREMTPIILASDWHVEEPVDPEAVAYRNEYNLEIADRRIKRFFQGIIWKVEHDRASGRIAIRDMVLSLLGDLITGYIHEELVENNSLSPTETVLWLIPRIRDGIATLLDVLNLERLVVVCSYGNHGRTTSKSRIVTGYANSYEWLMYHQLASEFRNEPRVQFEITASAHQYVSVYDFIVHVHHGDEVRFQGGVGGLSIPLLKRVPMWDRIRPAHVHCIGHHHQLKDFGRAFVNGSLIGYNAYAQSIGADFEPPQQLLFYIDSKRGRCMPFSIWVDDDDSHGREIASSHGVAA